MCPDHLRGRKYWHARGLGQGSDGAELGHARKKTAAPRAVPEGGGRTDGLTDYRQPDAKTCWKQMKSFTLRTGGIVLLSQFARDDPAA